MRRQLEDIREFLTQVGNRVIAWITGGVIAAALFIVEHLEGNLSPWALYWGVLAYVTVASYLAWRDQREAFRSAEQNAQQAIFLAEQRRKVWSEQRPLSMYWAFVVAEQLGRAPLEDIEHPFALATADPKRFAEVSMLIRNGIKRSNPIGPQPYDLDSFKLLAPKTRGIVIYGNNAFAEAIAKGLSQVAHVFRSNEQIDELNAYYAKFGKTDVVGIAIGPGAPWKDECLD